MGGGLSGGLQHTSTPSNAAAMFDTYGDLYDQYEEEEDEAPSFTSNIDENGEKHIHIYHRHPIPPISPIMNQMMPPFMPPPPMAMMPPPLPPPMPPPNPPHKVNLPPPPLPNRQQPKLKICASAPNCNLRIWFLPKGRMRNSEGKPGRRGCLPIVRGSSAIAPLRIR